MTPNPPRVPPRVSDERLAWLIERFEALQRVDPGYQSRGDVLDTAADLRDARARITALETALGVAENELRFLERQPKMNDPWYACATCGGVIGHFDGCKLKAALAALEAIRSEGEK